MRESEVFKLLECEVVKRDVVSELSIAKPDPLLVAREYRDEYIALICALFAYGNARLIVKFLQSLDFSLLTKSEEEIKRKFQKHYYRFQNSRDVIGLFIMLRRAKSEDSLENIFSQGYRLENSILDGLYALISWLENLYDYKSRGYHFLIGRPPVHNTTSTYKRWNMFLRWMVRKDSLDMGLWHSVEKKDLLIPLDTHTFKVAQKLGLLKRKSYDLKAVILLTQTLKQFDVDDPVKYDFALYRIGQEKILATLK